MKPRRCLIFFLLVLFLFPGCAPILSKAAIQDSRQDFLFGDLLRSPENYIGQKLLLGGTIISVTNESSRSVMEVLHRPLGFRLEPKLNDQSEGRFLLIRDSIFDDKVFFAGRKISVSAEVIGKEVRPLDQTTYTYPVLRLREYHLWPIGHDNFGSRFTIGIGIGAHF